MVLCHLESHQRHDCRGSKPEALAKILESNFRSGFQLVGEGWEVFVEKLMCAKIVQHNHGSLQQDAYYTVTNMELVT